ncbi:MAG: proline--tRNA ligase [Clostridiaceae bacterium]|nr:proline--tRNA ligase [Clostridiaceae bacterium]
MYFSKMFLPTLREVPAEAEIISHKLMLRAGLIRKLASGIYSFLPLGLRVLKKIEQVVREEMDSAGAQELLMPALLPAESFRESGRWEVFGPEMFRLKDRNDREFCLGPTHEEIFTGTVKSSLRSYRSLPVILYQIQTKYRDEIRPRFGVMRSREFIMKDAYSFDRDEAGLDDSYMKMEKAYRKIFDRLGLDYKVVEADSGAMGGSGSQEFMVISEIGEDGIAYCEACGYGANEEKASCSPKNTIHSVGSMDESMIEKIHTPNIHTITELTEFLGCDAVKMAKTLIYKADGKLVAAMVRGDRELNEVKLKNVLECTELEMADAESVRSVTNAEVGFAGPVGLKIRIIADHEVAQGRNLIVGANETDHHLLNVNIGRDFDAEVHDIRFIAAGDACPCCGKSIILARGIEVGHIFKLGTKYSSALACNYSDEEGNERPMVMGSYGIGINRTMAAVIEQHHDENGIIWPMEIAPYHVIIVPVNVLDEKVMKIAEVMYQRLTDAGLEVILDDRNERAGVKFMDADLIGIPIRINVGRKAAEGIVEYKPRGGKEALDLTVEEAIEKIMSKGDGSSHSL